MKGARIGLRDFEKYSPVLIKIKVLPSVDWFEKNSQFSLENVRTVCFAELSAVQN